MVKHKRKQDEAGHTDTDSTRNRPAASVAEVVRPKQDLLSIDQIFATAKAKAPARGVGQVTSTAPRQLTKPSRHTPAGSKDDLFGTSAQRKRRRDPEGLAIYSAEELRVGEGGGTPQCPFDCDCCF